MGLDDLDDRFAAAVKLALGASRSIGYQSDLSEDAECPSSDMIASYYEYALNRVERARLETHFSGCARCQSTLAALLRTAPTIDTASEAGGFAVAAARRAAAESDGIRERWFEIRPAWRIVGVAVATAILAVVVVAGVHVYQGRIGRGTEQVAALSPAPAHHHRYKSYPASTASSDDELALNDKKTANKSLMPTAPTKSKTATAPSAAAAAPSVPATVPANAPVETGASEEEVAPPVAPSNGEQDETAPATAAQAAAALGALAAMPAPATGAAPSTSAAPSIAATPPRATSPATRPASSGASGVASNDNSAAVADAAVASAITTGATAGRVATKTAAPPASEAVGRTTKAAPPAAVNEKRQQLVALAAPSARPEQFQQRSVAQATAKALESAREGNSLQSMGVAEPAATADATALARERAQQQLEAKRKAEIARKADIARQAELARKAELAKRDAELKRQMERARREQAQYAMTSSSVTSSRRESASIGMRVASAPSQSRRVVSGAGSAIAPTSLGATHAVAHPTASSSAATAGSGNGIAMAEPSVMSAPVVAAIAPGIPVAPRAVLISPPDHAVYWSLQRDGVIYRTNDRKSWAPQFTGVQAELLAGMAPSDTVCWAVGRKGVILLTTDGVHWERINSPTVSDLIGITAASKDVATIFTSGGANYSTFDGGSNWEQAH